MKQTCTFVVITKDSEVIKVGNSVIYQPKTKPIIRQTKWFDDSQLIKPTIN